MLVLELRVFVCSACLCYSQFIKYVLIEGHPQGKCEAMDYDVFISHASEDKAAFVKPLAEDLARLGVHVWYDEFALKLGDSLSRSIDKGLALSKFGIVVLSKAFLSKPWPEYELRGLVTREIGKDKVILPVWHNVTRDDIMAFSPPLADKLALNTIMQICFCKKRSIVDVANEKLLL